MPITKVSFFAVLVLSVSSFASAGFAQDDMRARGDKACKGDAPRLCRHAFEGGDMAILACFQENRNRLSATCRKFLTEIGQLH